ncbi:MAG: histidine kinase [Bacteroidales bacterium]|nr:histidine kinase [Bacteroidales bacterium]
MKKQTILIIHILSWVVLGVFMFLNKWIGTFIPPYQEMILFKDFINMVAPHIIVRAIFYIIIFYLFYFLKPKIFAERNYGYKTGAILLLTIISIALYLYLNSGGKELQAVVTFIRFYSANLLTAILGSLFRFAIDWIKLKIKSEELQKQNLQGELNLLKNQISPHFFFNTLNNIDSLIKSNAEKASETLVKLSEIMRYMIYDTKVNKVSLASEIKHIENYIELQAIQYANKNLVSLTVKGAPENISIAPIMFVSFVENAFKHCTDKEIDDAIQFQFSIEGDIVTFESRNLADKTKLITKDDSSGVGLDIIKRRLELIYPEKHKLEIKEEDDSFKVFLRITTNDN